jgi:hypothetical protein
MLSLYHALCSTTIGGESQVVEVQLKEGQKLRAETGCLLYMTNGVEMDTGTGGGMMKGVTRMFTGENFFVSDFSYTLKVTSSSEVSRAPSSSNHVQCDDFPFFVLFGRMEAVERSVWGRTFQARLSAFRWQIIVEVSYAKRGPFSADPVPLRSKHSSRKQ